MVGAGLPIQFTENGIAFSEFDLAFSAQSLILPPYELVIVRVSISRDEGAIPVYGYSEVNQVGLIQRWIVVDPVSGVSELADLLLRNSQLLHYFVLSFAVFIANNLARLNLTFQSLGCGADRCARAVKCEWEKRVLARLLLETHLEFCFRYGKSMS